MDQTAQWVVIAGLVLTGLYFVLRGARAIVGRLADDGKEDALDDVVRYLDQGKTIVEAIGGALGVDLKEGDTAEEAKDKALKAHATGEARKVRAVKKKAGEKNA